MSIDIVVAAHVGITDQNKRDDDMANKECNNEECECCVCHGHEWVIEHHSNGVGHSWIEAECQYCDAEITEEELEE